MEFTERSCYVKQLNNRDGKPWRGFFEYYVPGDKKKHTVSKVFDADKVKTEKQAERALKKWRDDVMAELAAKQETKPDASMDVAEYVVQATRRRIITDKLEASTIYNYRFSMQHVSDGFAGISLCDLKAAHVRDWIAGMVEQGLSPATISKAFRLLKAALDDAVDDDVIPGNPCSKKTVQLPATRKEKPNVLDERGRAALTALLSGGIESTPLGIAANLARFTGMRRGEICALRWCDVDLDAATIYVSKSIGIKQGGCYLKEPKSEKGKRSIPIQQNFLPILAAYRDAMHEEWASIARKSNGELNEREFQSLFVLGTLDGRFQNPTRLGKAWQALAESFNLRGSEGKVATLHDLRHCFATIAVANSDVKSTSSILGHSTAALTMDVYAGDDEAAKRRTAEAVARAYGF